MFSEYATVSHPLAAEAAGGEGLGRRPPSLLTRRDGKRAADLAKGELRLGDGRGRGGGTDRARHPCPGRGRARRRRSGGRRGGREARRPPYLRRRGGPDEPRYPR